MTKDVRIEEKEDRIKFINDEIPQYECMIDDYYKSIDKIKDWINNLQKRITNLSNERDELTIDVWHHRGEFGLNKGVKFSEVPDVIRWKRDVKFCEISHFCPSALNSCCNCCDEMCSDRATEQWCNEFGFDIDILKI